jgi:hypothetical protein
MSVISPAKRKNNSSASQTGAKKPTERYRYARALAKKGFRIFPLKVNSKEPLRKGWQEEAAPDASPWANGEDYNIGVATGQGVTVADIDMKKTEEGDLIDGETNWKEFCDEHDVGESPVQVATASEIPGRHIIYTTPLDAKIPNSVGKIAAGVDVRGEGGYVVGVGSVIDEREYTKLGTWGLNGGRGLAMPAALIEACGKGGERAADDIRNIPEGELDTELNMDRAREYLIVARESVQGAGGDQNSFAVAAKVRDMGISQEMCLDIMMEDGGWNERCSPPWSLHELGVKVSNAYRYAQKRIGEDSPEAQFADEPDSGETEVRELSPLELMNQRFALVTIGTGYIILEEYIDQEGRNRVRSFGEKTFHLVNVNNYFVDAETGKKTYWSRVWILWEHRRTYYGFTFDPKHIGSVSREYNHWRGFTYEPIDGLPLPEAKRMCEKFLLHVRNVVCAGDVRLYKWLMNHFAHLIQFPWKKPETAVVVLGRKGVGKSLIFDIMGALMKDNYLVTAQERMLLGNFNSHMETALLVQFEEAFWAGNKKAEGVLKHLITGKHHIIEHKGHEPYMVANYARIYITSNEDWAIPATVDERRFAVIECSDARRGDKEYFNEIFRQLQMGNGMGYRALMTLLRGLDVDLTAVHVAPDTSALADQKLETLDSTGRWLHNCLEAGEIDGLGGEMADDGSEWQAELFCTDVYDHYVSYTKSQGFRYPVSNHSFGRWLTKVLGKSKLRKQVLVSGHRHYVYQFADLKTCRKSFELWLGHEITW